MKTKIALLLTAALLSACASTGSTPVAQPGGDTASIAAAKPPAVKPYPLKTCLVTDNALDSMGGEVRLVNNGQEIKFCCKPCIAKFKKNPDKYLAKIK